jgi:hypothetical protein
VLTFDNAGWLASLRPRSEWVWSGVGGSTVARIPGDNTGFESLGRVTMLAS